MQADQLDALYGRLADAIGRVGERDASLFLATLVLDLISQQPDAAAATAAFERAERLTRR